MRSFIFFMTGLSIFVTGCTSYFTVTEQDHLAGKPRVDDKILIILSDKSTIEAEPYRHIQTTEPSEFIYGIGNGTDSAGKGMKLQGMLLMSDIDSMSGGVRGGLNVRLKNGGRLIYEEKGFVHVTPDQGPGLWCVGMSVKEGTSLLFKGKISEDKVKEVRIRKSDPVKSVALTAAILAPPIIFLIIFSTTFPGH